MNSKTLITFGCSWTFGVGVGYQELMSKEELKKIAWDENLCNKKSFRGLLSQRYQYNNLNLAEGGSSNQKQFRKAKRFFNSKQFDQLRNNQDEIIVLWGITSTARNEVFSVADNKLINYLLNDTNEPIQKFLLKHTYDHEHEIFLLVDEMLHWNRFFESHNIKNYWFDTFNHHDYFVNHPSLVTFKKLYGEVAGPDWPTWKNFIDRQFDFDSEIVQEILNASGFHFSEFVRIDPVKNFVINHSSHRDLMSQLAIKNGMDKPDSDYHLSNWLIDSKRVEFLVSKKLLNPYSHHPTELCHQQLANMFDHIFAN
jgi:hypothetical protein